MVTYTSYVKAPDSKHKRFEQYIQGEYFEFIKSKIFNKKLFKILSVPMFHNNNIPNICWNFVLLICKAKY